MTVRGRVGAQFFNSFKSIHSLEIIAWGDIELLMSKWQHTLLNPEELYKAGLERCSQPPTPPPKINALVVRGGALFMWDLQRYQPAKALLNYWIIDLVFIKRDCLQ